MPQSPFNQQTQPVIDACISGFGSLTVQEVVNQLAIPIEEEYENSVNQPPHTSNTSSSSLWNLWFSVLHTAKHSPWQNETCEARQKLLELVQAFKDRPDPAFMRNLSAELDCWWFYEDGKLWSNLTLLGPCGREMLSDTPGHITGLTEVDIEAWCNLHAFCAHLSKRDIYDFWEQGLRALRDATEGQSRGSEEVDEQGVRIAFRESLVWLHVAGREMWEVCCRSEGPAEEVPVDISPQSPNCPLYRSGEFSIARWKYWRRRFEVVSASKNRKWNEGTKCIALEAKVLMEVAENAV